MPVTLDEILSEMPAESRVRIDRRVQEIREELNLRELRRLRRLTQARLSKKLKIGQEGVSRMEKRSDLYLSTLRSYVEAVGGELTLVARFPDRPPVVLSGFGLDEDRAKAKKKTIRKAAKSSKSKTKTRRAA
jgi:transcriptional regulator with XRE-family HTH domain